MSITYTAQSKVMREGYGDGTLLGVIEKCPQSGDYRDPKAVFIPENGVRLTADELESIHERVVDLGGAIYESDI